MKTPMQSFLEDPARLDHELMGLRLHKVLEDLGWSGTLPTVEEGADPTAGVRQLLGDHLPAILAGGLASLPRSSLEQLLEQPQLLLQLQELLLCAGSPYWEQLSGSLPELSPLALPSPGPQPRKRSGWRAAVVLAAALLAVGGGVAGLLEWDRRHRSEVAALARQLAAVKQQRDEAVQKLPAQPQPPDDGPRLALLCRTLATLSDLPPQESMTGLPADETSLGPSGPPGPPDEVMGLAPDEPDLGADSPRQRAPELAAGGGAPR